VIELTEEDIIKEWEGDIDKPIVSICTITYNHEKYISQALDSFLMQKCNFPFEIIIDDDCSIDKTADIIKEYKERYPNIIKANLRQKNVGMFINGFENINKAKGKYIALCDGDDYWIDPYKLKKQVEFLDNNPDFTLVGSRVKLNNQNSETIGTKPGVYEYRDMLQRCFLLTLTVMFRRENYTQEAKEFIKSVSGGDWAIFLTQLKYGKAKVFEEPFGVYREHSGGVFSSLDTFNKHLTAIKTLKNFINQNIFFSEEEKYYLIKGIRNRISQLFVLDFKYDKDRVEEFLKKEAKVFLTKSEYTILISIFHINRYIFGRVAWRLMRFNEDKKINFFLTKRYKLLI